MLKIYIRCLCTIGLFMSLVYPTWATEYENKMDGNQEMTLVEAIRSISEDYGVYFTFDHTLVKDMKVHYVKKDGLTVEQAVSGVLEGTNLHFKFYDQRFVILYKNDKQGLESLKEMMKHFGDIIQKGEEAKVDRSLRPLSEAGLLYAWSPELRELTGLVLNVSGTVTDVNNEPLIGVNVQVKGTDKGTATDFDGNYSLNDVNENAILVFSYIGYQTVEVPLDGRTELSIQLISDSELLDEVVVVGYGIQKKVNLTGAVGVIEADQLENRPIASVEEALQGQVSGLNVVRTGGQPGNQTIDFKIRGASTFTSNPVLTIIDGVPSSLDRINPNDIESISVLKDAASASIYGSRAAGGVILVTTKSGGSGKPRINIKSTISLQDPTRWPEKPSAFDYATMRNLALVNDGTAPFYTESDLARFSSSDWQDHDWDGYLINQAIQSNHNVSISGGTDAHKYYMSIGLLDQNGIVINSDFQRLNFQLNQVFNIGEKLKLDVRGGYSPSKGISPSSGWSPLRFIYSTQKTEPFLSEDGKWLQEAAHTQGGNALAVLSEDGGQRLSKSNRLNGNFKVTYNIWDQLDFTAGYGIVGTNEKNRSYKNILKVYDPIDQDKVAVESVDNYLDIDYSEETLQNINLFLNYSKNISGHELSFLGGMTREWYNNTVEGIGTRDFLTDNIYVIDAGSSDPNFWSVNGTASDWALESYIARANYSYNDKYLFEASARYDGSSRFSEDRRWGFFPSFSAGWVASNEDFLSSNSVLTFLKFRLAWGQVGNQNVGFYPFANRLAQSAYFFNGSPQRAVGTAGAPNPLLTWETKEAINLGIEGSIFNNLLEFDINLFSENAKNILLQLPLPTTFGQAEPVQNAGQVDNMGWELELRHRNTLGDFSYGLSFQISDSKNNIVSMGGISPRISGYSISEEDYSMDEWFGYKAIGFFQSDDEANNSATQNPQVGAGDIKYLDANNDGEINSDDRVRLGRSDPRLPFGVRINFDYKNFNFIAFGQGVMSHNAITRPWEISSVRSYHLDYWTPENTDAKFPSPRVGGGPLVGINKEFSSFWLEDASYFRLKQLQVGYTISGEKWSNLKLGDIQLYVSAENLITFTKYLGYDPELATGLDIRQLEARYPLSRLFNFGVNINL
ncbi:SusC/RagA family TonB-linked outer membrane protein [Membranihabitans marinus]|uniref:SusC/RagA family TonB-linked outer membrane protein n=1 Tax=Membranihabitans marinus TaxID=1227546 RepID=UPI001F361C56|nr:TonB-dependent receptor [Membranihabitans marinus]